MKCDGPVVPHKHPLELKGNYSIGAQYPVAYLILPQIDYSWDTHHVFISFNTFSNVFIIRRMLP